MCCVIFILNDFDKNEEKVIHDEHKNNTTIIIKKMILIKQEPGYTTQRFYEKKCLTRNKESGNPR
jgi:hypothetical protein